LGGIRLALELGADNREDAIVALRGANRHYWATVQKEADSGASEYSCYLTSRRNECLRLLRDG
jgi:hypothetical protein